MKCVHVHASTLSMIKVFLEVILSVLLGGLETVHCFGYTKEIHNGIHGSCWDKTMQWYVIKWNLWWGKLWWQ